MAQSINQSINVLIPTPKSLFDYVITEFGSNDKGQSFELESPQHRHIKEEEGKKRISNL